MSCEVMHNNNNREPRITRIVIMMMLLLSLPTEKSLVRCILVIAYNIVPLQVTVFIV